MLETAMTTHDIPNRRCRRGMPVLAASVAAP
jgi:hypothetical protein